MKPNNHIGTDLSALTFLCLLARIPWLFLVPTAGAPDEISHLWVVKFLVEHARLPTRTDVFASGSDAVYGSLPQIGYIPHLVVSKSLPFWHVAVTARLGSLLMGVCLVWIAYFIARELYSTSRLTCLALPLIIIFHPQMVFLNAYTNCDSTAIAAASLILLFVVRMIKRGLTLWGCSAVGALSAVAILSKYSAMSTVASSICGLILAGWLNGASWQLIVAAAGLVVSTFALSCNWWFVRELTEYPGDLLGTKTMRHSWAVDFNKTIDYKTSFAFLFTKQWWRMTYFSFWGQFGYMTVYLPKPFYFGYLFLQGIAIAGGVSHPGRMREFLNNLKLKARVKDIQDLTEENLESLKYGAIYLMFFLGIAANLAAMIWSSSQNLGGAQGRYLFSNEIPFVALTISGLDAISANYGKKLIVVFLIFNAVVCTFSFFQLYHLYGGFAFKP